MQMQKCAPAQAELLQRELTAVLHNMAQGHCFLYLNPARSTHSLLSQHSARIMKWTVGAVPSSCRARRRAHTVKAAHRLPKDLL